MRRMISVLTAVALAGLLGSTVLAEKETLMVYTSCPIEIMTEIERDCQDSRGKGGRQGPGRHRLGGRLRLLRKP